MSTRRGAEVARLLSGALLVSLACLAIPFSALAQEDPNLEQRIGSGQRIVTAKKVLAGGHVDIGPRFVDGEWRLMIHDDAAKGDAGAESVWRHTEQTVLRVTDEALLPVPDDPAYTFLGVEPGTEVHVIPQTQDPDVVWVGWNTQDPEVMETIDRGATMTLTGLQGPGDLVVYLQSGDFADPQVLWDSTAEPAPAWIDVNTHTHANWVFSEPGVYLVRLAVTAELIDGSTVADTRELRFAVGSSTSTDDALAAVWRGAVADGGETTSAVASPAPEAADGGPVVLAAAIATAAAGLAGALVGMTLRGNRAKRRARARARPGGDGSRAGGG